MLPGSQEVEEFVESVSEVSRLIEGLKAGTISPAYVDGKLAAKSQKQQAPPQQPAARAAAPAAPRASPEAEVAKQEELRAKVDELMASRARKQRARQLYEQHTAAQAQRFATDYTKWGLWCPSDEEDELFASCTPNSAEFRSMERDINERHARMVEQRQVAERQRVAGNAAFAARQYGEALRCYQAGLEAQRHDIALHANAAAAALKLGCCVAALEHCDKVLHIAEALHGNPRHPLCVKALQRRAAAHQALEQHSKAVSDLQAAAAMLPGDKEVGEQLSRAQQLLEEHRAAKKMKGLVSSGGAAAASTSDTDNQTDAPRSSSSGGGGGAEGVNQGELASLQRIEQLVAALGASGAGAAAGVSAAAAELRGIIRHAPRCVIYFRECGGLAAAAALVATPQRGAAAATVACLQLLDAACTNAASQEQLAAKHPHALAAALELLAPGQDPAVTAAALDLLHSVSVATATRQALGRQLLQQRKVVGSERLQLLWDACCCRLAELPSTAAQAAALALLSNCMLLPAVREAAHALLQQQPARLASLVALLQPSSSSSGGSAGLSQHLFGLLSNLCMHAGLLAQLAGKPALLAAVLAVALPAGLHVRQQQRPAAPAAVRAASLAALGCLCNLSTEPCVQQALAADGAALSQLLALACRWQVWADVDSTSSGGSSGRVPKPASAAAGLGSQLPAKTARQQQCVAAAEGRRLQAQRAACVLARAAKCAGALAHLQQQGALARLLAALEEGVLQPAAAAMEGNLAGQANAAPAGGAEAAAAPAKEQQQQQQQPSEGAATWAGSLVQAAALLTASPGAAACSGADVAAAVRICLGVLRPPACAALGAAARANAALCLSNLAGGSCSAALRALRDGDAVGVLLDAARAGCGDALSRNAAIALAKLAQDGAMLERLRALRGIEIMYAYARP